MLPPEVTDQPPYAVHLVAKSASVDVFGHTDDTGHYTPPTWSGAIARLADEPLSAPAFIYTPVLAFGDKTGGGSGTLYRVQATRAEYYFAFFTATCYLDLYWDEIIEDIVGAITQVSSTPREYHFTGGDSLDGLCLLAGFDLGDYATYSHSTATAAEAPEPPTPAYAGADTQYRLRIGNIRWSCVPDYTPPIDGSANGFPA